MEQLCQELSGHYEVLETHVPLFKGRKAKRRRLVAEIDIVGYRDGEVHVYEVKCSPRIAKARRQLRKIRMLVHGVSRTFFFCGESGMLTLVHRTTEHPVTLEEVAEL